MQDKDKDKERRKQENRRILDRLFRNESLSTVSVEATWFPPRPTIKKDLSKLYPEMSSPKLKPLSLVGDNDEKTTS